MLNKVVENWASLWLPRAISYRENQGVQQSDARSAVLVQKMVNKVFASGELAECELSLRELHEIAKCFTRVLTGIYHQRVAYSEPAEKVSEKDGGKVEGEGEAKGEEMRSEAEEPAAPQEKKFRKAAGKGKKVASKAVESPSEGEAQGKGDKEGNGEDLKRLGL